MEALSADVASQEIEKWLDQKRISPAKRILYVHCVHRMVSAMCEGRLVLREDMVLEQTLLFPVGDKQEVKKFEFKPRVTVGELADALRGVEINDSIGRACAAVAAVTGQLKGIVAKMDPEDYSLSDSIIVFFIPT